MAVMVNLVTQRDIESYRTVLDENPFKDHQRRPTPQQQRTSHNYILTFDATTITVEIHLWVCNNFFYGFVGEVLKKLIGRVSGGSLWV